MPSYRPKDAHDLAATDKLNYDPTQKQGDTIQGTAISTAELRQRMIRTERIDLSTTEDKITDWILVIAALIAVILLILFAMWQYSVKFGGEEAAAWILLYQLSVSSTF